jgi:dUTP pyrophosphatase
MDKHGRGAVTEWLAPFLKVKKLHEDSIVPTRNNATDAGLDLYAYETITLAPRGFTGNYLNDPDIARAIIPTGIAIEFPPGYAFFIHDRSGLSAKYGIHRVAGVADESYRGEIKVALVNLSHKEYTINKGDRIAQGILMPIALPEVIVVEELSDTVRGVQGFGSSGK